MSKRKYLRLIVVFGLSALAAFAEADGKPTGSSSSAGAAAGPERSAVPPVLRRSEAPDSLFVLLPGPAPAPVPAAGPAPVVPEVKAPEAKAFVPPPDRQLSLPAKTAGGSDPMPPELADPGKPVLRPAPAPLYPQDFEKDSGLFCQKQIGHWQKEDALALLGVPAADRAAYDDAAAVNGHIYAFADPTSRYKRLELDFDSATGALRTVFLYPWNMSWQECRRTWGGNVSATEAKQGRRFYSYLNRRVDVLVDAAGKVISIGMY